MEYVIVQRTADGFIVDPTAYLDKLGHLAPTLPPGARAFATDPQHYQFRAPHFVKNFKLLILTAGETAAVVGCSCGCGTTAGATKTT